VTECVNGGLEEDNAPYEIVMSEDDPHYDELMEVSLQDFDLFSTEAVKKKINSLFKVRREMKNNMTPKWRT
jgi:hypothetical protein